MGLFSFLGFGNSAIKKALLNGAAIIDEIGRAHV